jgi:hypothetical protein
MDEGALSIESHYSFEFLPEVYLSKKIPGVKTRDFFMIVFSALLLYSEYF